MDTENFFTGPIKEFSWVPSKICLSPYKKYWMGFLPLVSIIHCLILIYIASYEDPPNILNTNENTEGSREQTPKSQAFRQGTKTSHSKIRCIYGDGKIEMFSLLLKF